MFYTFHRCIFAKTKMLKEWLLLLFQQKNEKELMFILLESSVSDYRRYKSDVYI